jgi:hypothetical protein
MPPLISNFQSLFIEIRSTDSDLPKQAISYSINQESIDAGLVIDASSGLLSWTPLETQGPDAYVVVVTAQDDGSPPLNGTQSFTVHVTEVNVSPTLIVGDFESVGELTEFRLEVHATDPDVPNTLTFSIDEASAAQGMVIAPIEKAEGISASAAITWTPSEDQGPGGYSIDIKVTDSGPDNLTDSVTVVLNVLEANTAPELHAIGDKSVDEGGTLAFIAQVRKRKKERRGKHECKQYESRHEESKSAKACIIITHTQATDTDGPVPNVLTFSIDQASLDEGTLSLSLSLSLSVSLPSSLFLSPLA